MPPHGEIMTNFVEAKGMYPMNASFTFPVLVTKTGTQWTRPDEPVVGYSRGMAVMPDGRTMVRPALTFGSDSISFGPAGCDKQVNSDGSIGYCHTQYSHGRFNGVEISTDAGLTWGGATYLASQQEVDMCIVTGIKPLRDGRLVAVLGLRKRGASGDVLHHMAVGKFVGNATVAWQKPIPTLPAKFGTCVSGLGRGWMSGITEHHAVTSVTFVTSVTHRASSRTRRSASRPPVAGTGSQWVSTIG